MPFRTPSVPRSQRGAAAIGDTARPATARCKSRADNVGGHTHGAVRNVMLLYYVLCDEMRIVLAVVLSYDLFLKSLHPCSVDNRACAVLTITVTVIGIRRYNIIIHA